jgi:hypothetical protein
MRYFILSLILTVRLTAATYYVTQSGAGSGNGSSIGNAASIATLNGHMPAAGDTVSLNGAITSGITVNGSGASGNPITYLFASGASMSTTVWNSAFTLANNNYITIDGGATGTIGGPGATGTTNGYIQNTANGTGLANTAVTNAIAATDCNNLTIQGLVIRNLYVRNSSTDESAGASSSSGIYVLNSSGNLTNLKVTNCVFHDMNTGVGAAYRGSACMTWEVSYCTAYNCNWGAAFGDAGTSGQNLTGATIHHNLFYNFSNWDDSVSNLYHHNGFYGYAESGGGITGATIYDNQIGPGAGTNATAHIFLSGNLLGTFTIYNNIFLADSTGNPNNGNIYFDNKYGTGTTLNYYNNTSIGYNSSGIGVDIDALSGTSGTVLLKNNLFSGDGTAIAFFHVNLYTATADYNLGYNLNSGQAYSWSSSGGSNPQTFAQWQADGFDTHGTNGNPNLNGSYVPQPTSSAISAGANLSSYFTTDYAGVTRPASTAWDIGAYEYGAPVGATILNCFKFGNIGNQ